MKISKRFFSFTFSVIFILACALPASAYTVVLGRQSGNFSYYTSDTCNTNGFTCVIEADSTEYTLATHVDVYTKQGNTHIRKLTAWDTPDLLISRNSAGVNGFSVSYIDCKHMLSDVQASWERVWAS